VLIGCSRVLTGYFLGTDRVPIEYSQGTHTVTAHPTTHANPFRVCRGSLCRTTRAVHGTQAYGCVRNATVECSQGTPRGTHGGTPGYSQGTVHRKVPICSDVWSWPCHAVSRSVRRPAALFCCCAEYLRWAGALCSTHGVRRGWGRTTARAPHALWHACSADARADGHARADQRRRHQPAHARADDLRADARAELRRPDGCGRCACHALLFLLFVVHVACCRLEQRCMLQVEATCCNVACCRFCLLHVAMLSVATYLAVCCIWNFKSYLFRMMPC
jgi:hypothetical protein